MLTWLLVALVTCPLISAAAAQGLAPPVITHQTKPKFPIELRRAGTPGLVVMDYVLNTSGRFAELEPVIFTEPDFARAAKASMLEWTFTPATKDGHPVNIHLRVPIFFDLNGHPPLMQYGKPFGDFYAHLSELWRQAAEKTIGHPPKHHEPIGDSMIWYRIVRAESGAVSCEATQLRASETDPTLNAFMANLIPTCNLHPDIARYLFLTGHFYVALPSTKSLSN